jgi:hypothetical protein
MNWLCELVEQTSMIHYLAKRTGHRLVRINNHEHTDIQEHIGQYITDSLTGKLKFQEGILVEAVKNVCNPSIIHFNIYIYRYLSIFFILRINDHFHLFEVWRDYENEILFFVKRVTGSFSTNWISLLLKC